MIQKFEGRTFCWNIYTENSADYILASTQSTVAQRIGGKYLVNLNPNKGLDAYIYYIACSWST